MRSIAVVARLTLLDLFRRNAFRGASLLILAAAAIAAIPFSPGIAADPGHYMDAGISTLYLGGIFLAVMAGPLLLINHRGHGISSAILSLPINRFELVLGMFFGFAVAMVLFFLLGTLLLLVPGHLGIDNSGAYVPIVNACKSLLVSLMIFSIALLFSQVLSFTATVVVVCMIVTLGYLAPYLPNPLYVTLPALYYIDPLLIKNASVTVHITVYSHAISLICMCLILAAHCLRKTGNRRGIML